MTLAAVLGAVLGSGVTPIEAVAIIVIGAAVVVVGVWLVGRRSVSRD